MLQMMVVILLRIATSTAVAQNRLPIKWAKINAPKVEAIAHSPNGLYRAIGGTGGVQIVQASTGSVIQALPTAIHSVTSLAFSPDSSRLAVGGSSFGGVIEVWNVRSGSLLRDLHRSAGISTLSYTPDGGRLVAGFQGNTVSIFTADSLTLTDFLTFSATLIAKSMAVSQDGNLLAIGGISSGQAQVEVRQLSTHKLIATLNNNVGQPNGVEWGVNAISFSRNSQTLAFSAEQLTFGNYFTSNVVTSRLTLWDVTAQKVTQSFLTIDNHALAFSPDGKLILGAGETPNPYFAPPSTYGEIDIWSVSTGKLTNLIRPIANSVQAMAFSTDGSTLVTGGYYQSGSVLEKWHLSDLSWLDSQVIQQSPICSMVPSSNGRYLAVDNVNLEILDSASGAIVSVPPLPSSQNSWTYAWIQGTQLLVVVGFSTNRNVIQVVDALSGNVVANLLTQAKGSLNAFSMVNNGKVLVTATQQGNNPLVEVWDLATFSQIGTLGFGSMMPVTMAISPDGSLLGAAESTTYSSQKPRILTLNLKNGQPVSEVNSGLDRINAISFTPDGRKLIDGGYQSTNSGYIGFMESWDPLKGSSLTSPVLSLDHPPIEDLRFSPDGNILYVGTDKDIELVNVNQWGVMGTYTCAGATSIGFTLGGSAIAVLDASGSLQVNDNPMASTATVKSASLAPSVILAGQGTTGSVTISKAAPIGGVNVILSTNDPTIQVPAFVSIAAGSTKAGFAISTWSSTVDIQGVINARSGSASASGSLTLKANQPKLIGLILSPTKAAGGKSIVGQVTLSLPAPSTGAMVSLSVSGTGASVQDSVVVQPGQTSAIFTINTNKVKTITSISVTAKLRSTVQTATLEIDPN